jgi:2-polyprenyl-6-methoxyphenol hydroxylase-like FAD-dependent oxidoreductase
LASAIFGALKGDVETVFNDTVTALVDDGRRVHAEFARSAARDFDLVVGADGLHSRVRRLAFGPETEFEQYLGLVVGVFDVAGYRPRDELVAVSHTEVGGQILRVALRNDTTVFAFTFRHDGEVPIDDVLAQQQLLRWSLRKMGGEVPAVLAQMPQAHTFYLDRASQIRMPSWSLGRVALVGDAAACPSLLAGQGSALAMVEAYVLATELNRAADHRSAFAAYERKLAAVVRTKQDAAIGLTLAFAPRNRAQLFLRNAAMGLMALPFVATLVMARSLRDPISLPSFPVG